MWGTKKFRQFSGKSQFIKDYQEKDYKEINERQARNQITL